MLVLGWVLLTVAELWVAVQSLSDDDDGIGESDPTDRP